MPFRSEEISEPSFPLPIPPGGTATAARAFDWASTSLGPAEDWPDALKAAASIVLGANVPMMLAWGPELLVIHNDSYGEMLGDRHRGLGRPVSEVWAHNWDIVGPHVQRVLGGETIYVERAPRLMRRGDAMETLWLTACYNPVLDRDGKVAGLFGVVTAVVDEQTEQKLHESEERFRLIADSAPIPMWVTQLDRRRSFVNRAYVEFLGISREQAVDFDWRSIIHPEDEPRILAQSLAGEASLKTFALEGRFRCATGEYRWLRSISQPRWGAGGEHVGFIGAAVDVTDAKLAEQRLQHLNEELERRVAERTADLEAALQRLKAEVAERERAEEALRQAQKMEAVGRLTGGIAHDFNNLLTPVIGGLEIIAANVEEPRLKRLAEGALESGRRGAKLTTQLLAFSRLQRIRIAPVAVNRTIGNLRQILRHTIGHGITIRSALCDSDVHGLCDENQLENAILNLAINARDAMPEGGELTIATALLSEAEAPDLPAGDYVCITVADTGHGMPAEVAARATEPFFSTKPFGKGTGLGLAQVYGIAHQSGGTVRIDSEEGRGTTVRLYLPHVEAASTGADLERAGRGSRLRLAERSGTTVAVVDDDPDVRGFIADLVESLGHEARPFATPEAALEAIGADPPDLALIDFAMPSMNGAQLARALRQRHPQLRLAFVTGYAESDQLEAGDGSDVPVLRKPFGIDALAALIAEAVPERSRRG